MINKFNKSTDFLKSLIDSDFSVVDLGSKKKSFNIKSSIKLNTLGTLDVLNLLELNKSIKQLVRILQFLKSNFKSHLYILAEDKYLVSFLSQYLKDYSLTTSIQIKTTLPTNKEIIDEPRLVLILGNSSHHFQTVVKKKFVDNNIFLVSKINLNVETNFFGAYKIFNDLNDIKKIVFLIILLTKILNKEKTINA